MDSMSGRGPAEYLGRNCTQSVWRFEVRCVVLTSSCLVIDSFGMRVLLGSVKDESESEVNT
jgi:hypothetical protein